MKIGKRIEAQMVIEAFLIVSVTSFDFAIMPRSPGTNKLMLDLVVSAEQVKGMYSLGFGEMSKFHAIVGLNCLWSITEKDDGTFYKVYGGIAAVFLIGIDKTLP